MSLSKPKVDPRLRDALARLRNNHDFQTYQKYLAELEAYFTEQLIAANAPSDVPLLQGRIRQLSDLSDLTKETP